MILLNIIQWIGLRDNKYIYMVENSNFDGP